MVRPSKKIKLDCAAFVDNLKNADGRCSAVKELRKRIKALEADCGADSIVKRELVCRAVFIGLQLEHIESTAASGAALDWAAYVQLLNTYLGLLRSLGIESVKKAEPLTTYLESKS